jgi:sphinganine C4-monooxygenase
MGSNATFVGNLGLADHSWAQHPLIADFVAIAKRPGPNLMDRIMPQVSFDLYGTRVESADLGLILGSVLAYWIYATLLYMLELSDLKFIRRYKIDPPQRPGNKVSVGHVISRVAFQHLVQMVMAVGLVWAVPRNLDQEMEDLGTFLIKFMVGAFIVDTYQYWMHRLFHRNKFLYRNFHAVHHEVTAPYAFAALYNHPIEGLLMDTVSGGLPILILDMHPWTATLFTSFATMKTVHDHCGYVLPWDPWHWCFATAAYHDIHHWGRGIRYNFSQPFFTIWDEFGGTIYPYSLDELMSEEAKKEFQREEEGRKKRKAD